jgi:His-Xaa-Ser system protein HxsD
MLRTVHIARTDPDLNCSSYSKTPFEVTCSMIQELVAFDDVIHTIVAVKKAAYKFINLFSADISKDGSIIKCTLYFESDKSAEFIQKIVADFRKEVLDQDLRESLKLETENVRNLILAHAFSKTGLIKNE